MWNSALNLQLMTLCHYKSYQSDIVHSIGCAFVCMLCLCYLKFFNIALNMIWVIGLILIDDSLF